MLSAGSTQYNPRNMHLIPMAAESVVNALNLNAGAVVVVVVRMVAAKNENKNKNIFLFKQDKQELHSQSWI
jgi:hypothetical protein